MKLNKGLNRDTDHNNQLPNTYRDANNVVLTKEGDRLESELGSIHTGGLLSDALILGRITASDEVIIFQGYTSTNQLSIFRLKNETLTLILQTEYFNFSYDAPIQGEYKYNYKKELIILFYSDVDIPRILNVDNLGFSVTQYKEFTNPSDEIFTKQFSNFNEPIFHLSQVNPNGGSLLSGVYYLSIQYKLLDNTYTNFSLLSKAIFVYKFNPSDDWYNIYANDSGLVTSKGISVYISNLDNRYLQYRFGILYVQQASTTAYVTDDYNIANGSVTISNPTTFTEIDVSDVLVDNVSLNTVRASTIIDNRLFLANVETVEDIKYQKYACNITSEYVVSDTVSLDNFKNSYKDEVILFNKKSFMPFEVYAFYIRFIRKDTNTPTQAFHIPGRVIPTAQNIPSTDDDELEVYASAKQWHMKDYSGIVDHTVSANSMGVWENENEYYPNNNEYDGRYDYDNVNLGTVDLRNQRVRHHRFPSLRGLQDNGVSMFIKEDTTVNNVDISFSSPVVGVYPNSFNTLANSNVGSFEDSRTFVNTTSAPLVGTINYYFNIVSTGAYLAHLHIAELAADSSLFSTIYETTASPIATSQVSLPYTLAVGHKLRIDYGAPPNTGINYEIAYNSYFTFNVDVAVTVSSSAARILGIKFSNIEIPQYIQDTCSHYEILYAERSSGNLSVISNGFINQVASLQTIDHPYARLYSFDLQNSKPSLAISYLRHELTNDVSVHNPDVITTAASSENVYPITKSKYVLNDIGFSDPSNADRDEYISIEFNEYSHLSSLNLPEHCTSQSTAVIVSIINFNPNLYSIFTKQKLIRTGILYEIFPATTNTHTPTTVYGGDITVDLHGTFNLIARGGDSFVRNYLVPEYSFSNIGYRYTDDDPINLFFPKYNLIENTGGAGQGLDYQYGEVDGGDGSVMKRIRELHPLETGQIEIESLHDYYGYETILHSILDKEAYILFSIYNNFTNTFPYRIHRSIVQGTESYDESWRILRPNEYYDSVYDKGEIVQIDNDGRTLLLEHKYALLVLKGISELKFSDGVVSALGDADIFDNKATEILPTSTGYVGCQSKFASFRCPFGNVIVDRQQGKIFLYDNYQVDEISKYGLFAWFDGNLEYILTDLSDTGIYLFDNTNDILYDDDEEVIYATTEELEAEYLGIDNPFNNLGIICAYDKEYERLIFTKNQNAIGAGYSWTLSYYPRFKQWVSFHSIMPNSLFNNRLGIFMLKSLIQYQRGIFKLVSDTTHGNYYALPTYIPSFVDVCFATPYGIDKKYLSFSWNTTVKSLVDKLLHNVIFDKAIVYNYHRHSNEITLVNQTFGAGNVRETDGSWKLNDFRDLLSDKTLKMVDDLDIRELQYDTIPALSLYTNWYDKGLMIDTYIIIRLTFNNTSGDGIIINGIGASSIQTGRI